MAGSTAYSRVIDPRPFREIADSVGALFMFDAAHPAGLIAGGVHPSPVGVADVVTLTTHKTLRGPRGGAILCGEELAKRIDSAVFPGLQGGPLEHVIAAKAVAFAEAARPEFRDYAARVVTNARALAAALDGHGFRLVSGGTDNHMLLIDLQPFDAELNGKVAQEVLDRAGITLNRNTIPDDPRSPFLTSGLRLGTAAETTAGMGPGEMEVVAELIVRTLKSRDDEAELAAVRSEVGALCARFTPYPTSRGSACPTSAGTGWSWSSPPRRRPCSPARLDGSPSRWATSAFPARARCTTSRSPTGAVRPCSWGSSSPCWPPPPYRRSGRPASSRTHPR